ncbi:MAG: RnfABCDGE type electron transport complex subunit G [Bacteroidales bacterium]|jgi:electron transport complex protein RnfG|nr:RnfABCDGE type electron transport complex subunit G [Bacteroidales bacterium]
MKKKPSTLINMVVSLTVIATVAALCLGSVYTITKEPIELAKKAKQEAAIKAVLPEFDNLETETQTIDGGELIVNKATKNGELVGTAVETFTNKGFGGQIKLMVGLLPDGSIYDISVLSHSETPGLGDKIDIKKSDFPTQFKGKKPATFNLSVTKDGGDVDAITAATISSRAYCDAVQRASNTVKN